MVSVAGFEKNWAKKEAEGLRASKSMEKAIQTGKKIKVSPKTVSWERVCENIGKFLAHSIAIPRGFILHKFFPGKSSINEQVEKLRDTVGKTKELLWETEAQRDEIALAHKKAPSRIIGPQKIKEVFDTIKSQYPPNFVPPKETKLFTEKLTLKPVKPKGKGGKQKKR